MTIDAVDVLALFGVALTFWFLCAEIRWIERGDRAKRVAEEELRKVKEKIGD